MKPRGTWPPWKLGKSLWGNHPLDTGNTLLRPATAAGEVRGQRQCSGAAALWLARATGVHGHQPRPRLTRPLVDKHQGSPQDCVLSPFLYPLLTICDIILSSLWTTQTRPWSDASLTVMSLTTGRKCGENKFLPDLLQPADGKESILWPCGTSQLIWQRTVEGSLATTVGGVRNAHSSSTPSQGRACRASREWLTSDCYKKKRTKKESCNEKNDIFFMPFQIMWAFYAKVIIDTLCSREEPLLSWSGDLRPPCHRSGAQTKDWRAIVYFFIKTAVLRNQQETNFRCRWESNKVLWVALPTSGFRVSSKQTPEQRVTMETTSNHQTEEKKQQEKKNPPRKR